MISHDFLTQILAELGYKDVTDGVCLGYSTEKARHVALKRVGEFNKQLQQMLAYRHVQDLHDAIRCAEVKHDVDIIASLKAKVAKHAQFPSLWSALNTEEKAVLTHLQIVDKFVNCKTEEQRLALLEKSLLISEKDKQAFAIAHLLQQIERYQNPEYHMAEMSQSLRQFLSRLSNKACEQQAAIAHRADKKKDNYLSDVESLGFHTLHLSQSQLSDYLERLSALLPAECAVVISGYDHAVCCHYNDGAWCLDDIERPGLSATRLDAQACASEIFTSMREKCHHVQHAVVISAIFIAAQPIPDLERGLSDIQVHFTQMGLYGYSTQYKSLFDDSVSNGNRSAECLVIKGAISTLCNIDAEMAQEMDNKAFVLKLAEWGAAQRVIAQADQSLMRRMVDDYYLESILDNKPEVIRQLFRKGLLQDKPSANVSMSHLDSLIKAHHQLDQAKLTTYLQHAIGQHDRETAAYFLCHHSALYSRMIFSEEQLNWLITALETDYIDNIRTSSKDGEAFVDGTIFTPEMMLVTCYLNISPQAQHMLFQHLSAKSQVELYQRLEPKDQRRYFLSLRKSLLSEEKASDSCRQAFQRISQIKMQSRNTIERNRFFVGSDEDTSLTNTASDFNQNNNTLVSEPTVNRL